MTWSVPVAVMSGIYLAEYGRGKLASAVRFAVDTLTGVPSIIMGSSPTFSCSADEAVLRLGRRGRALHDLHPVVVRTTEEMLRTVPTTVREAALALGIARWKATLRITVRTAWPGS